MEMREFSCKFCGSPHIIRYGTKGGVQNWWCKDCKRKFADNDALPEMKTPIRQIGSAVGMYYRGMSLDDIRRHLDQQHNNYPSDSTVYEWVTRFTEEAVNKARSYTPNVGDVWVADETVLKIGGRNVWFWDLIDIKTRFLLASHLSYVRTAQHAKALVEKASKRAGKIPKVIITDSLYAYLDGIELAFGADTEHVRSKGFRVQPNTNVIERFHGTLKGRTKVMRGLKTPESAMLFMDGWLVHYNFFKPHGALKDKTPAEKAGLKFPLRNWLDVVTHSEPDRQTVSRERVILGTPRKIGRSKRNQRVRPRLRRVRQPKKPELKLTAIRAIRG